MKTLRKQKLLTILILVIAIASLSIGFAAYSATLNIASSASVNPNSDTFSVKFSTEKDSLTVGGVVPSSNASKLTATNGTINNATNPTIGNLSVTLKQPGDYVEYTVYARNEGEYTAYLNSVNFIGNKTCEAIGDTTASLVASACESIKTVVYIGEVRYEETTEISNHSLEKNTGEEIKIRLEYDSDGAFVDGDFRVNFNDVMLVYSTINDSTFMPNDIGSASQTGTLNSQIKLLATSTDENIDFSGSFGDTSGVYIRTGTENHVNPIYYYRGVIDNNNVLFANKCWKIVRTTETGGTKLIYNGTPTTENKCNGDNSMIGYSTYNDSYESESDVSYLYSDGTNSAIKQAIDTWYSANMTSYTSYLEDTVWCNDRSVTFSGYYENWGTDATIFGPYARNVQNYQPSLHCPAEYSLTTNATNASNKLTYPVALLTADELTLAGMGWTNYAEENYLNNYDYWWTMSPFDFEYGYARVFIGVDGGDLNYAGVDVEDGVRPSVSLAPGTQISGGDGTSALPYIIN